MGQGRPTRPERFDATWILFLKVMKVTTKIGTFRHGLQNEQRG